MMMQTWLQFSSVPLSTARARRAPAHPSWPRPVIFWRRFFTKGKKSWIRSPRSWPRLGRWPRDQYQWNPAAWKQETTWYGIHSRLCPARPCPPRFSDSLLKISKPANLFKPPGRQLFPFSQFTFRKLNEWLGRNFKTTSPSQSPLINRGKTRPKRMQQVHENLTS